MATAKIPSGSVAPRGTGDASDEPRPSSSEGRAISRQDIGPAELASVAEQAHDPLLLVSEAGELLFLNSACRRLAGWSLERRPDSGSPAALFGQAFSEHLVSVAIPGARQAGAHSGELVIETPSGSNVLVSLAVTAHGVLGSAPSFFSAMMRELRSPGAVDHAELAAARTGRERLAHLSHELRAPLSGVIGLSAVLLGGSLDQEQRECAETIQDGARALLKILNDLLDLSKLEAQKLELEPIDFDLRATLRYLRRLMSVTAEAKAVDLRWVVGAEVPALLHGDPGRLRQVLTNLLDNALKFTAGVVELNVGVEEEGDDRVVLRFSVTDNGGGIPVESIPHVFLPFVQLAGTQQRGVGAGLGLAISQQMVELLGGRLQVQSAPGAGAAFWFTAPFVKRQPVARPGEAEPPLVGKRVLVVDDAAAFRRTVSKVMSNWGIRVETASGLVPAMHELRQAVAGGDPFDLALVDLIMPDGSGVELGRQVLEDSALRGTILVCTTAVGQQGDGKMVEKLGFSAYLTKPFSPGELRECLGSLLSSDRRPRSTFVTRHSLEERRAASARLLLADDDPIHRGLILQTLERAGYNAGVVRDGQAAIEAAAQERYQLMLLDLQMPVMGGLETARVVRDPSSPVLNHKVPLVALSVLVDDDVRSRCAAAGFDAVLSKPIDPSLLHETVDRHLFRGQQELPVFDREGTLQRIGGSEHLLDELVSMFLQDAAALSQALEAAVAGADLAEVQRVAHRLQSGSVSVGAAALRESLRQLELAARGGDLGSVTDRLRTVQRQLGAFRESLAGASGEPQRSAPGVD